MITGRLTLSCDHWQIEVNIGLCKPLFNQSEVGILVGGMTKYYVKIVDFQMCKTLKIWSNFTSVTVILIFYLIQIIYLLVFIVFQCFLYFHFQPVSRMVIPNTIRITVTSHRICLQIMQQHRATTTQGKAAHMLFHIEWICMLSSLFVLEICFDCFWNFAICQKLRRSKLVKGNAALLFLVFCLYFKFN